MRRPVLQNKKAPDALWHASGEGSYFAILILAVIDRPTRKGWAATSFGSRSMRTGRRCTTLIQLPDAFCAGISEKAEPVPPEMPRTVP